MATLASGGLTKGEADGEQWLAARHRELRR